MILKMMQPTSVEYNIEYQSLCRSNFRNLGTPYTSIWKKKYGYWWKNTDY